MVNIQKIKIITSMVLVGILFWACENQPAKPKTISSSQKTAVITMPDFNADSAYVYVEAQVAFGPRVPGTEAHQACANWLIKKLESFGGNVTVQDFKTRVYTGKIYSGKNIIASFNPEAKKRIMLSAHWDSRPYADYDADEANHRKPIDGANDGASGVGVLLEMARLFQQQNPTVGVDIFFWDLEDYGEHRDDMGSHENSWGLGSQYWSKNPHKPGYRAAYGILLDMVGAANPTFYREYYSNMYASSVVDKVWRIAESLGYQNYFINQAEGVVMDDHYYINTIAGIPTIDIIHYNPANKNGFFAQWHTQGDNMEIIDKSTLEMVGKVVTKVVYHE
ncbi:MAG: M28 family peptidase [Bacteroidales bacterium]|nr:M28 family peptidase [Bacteroidales bacterium]